jgi:Restriction endonuclease
MDYQDLVAVIESAFDPGADVRVSEWVEGPDGKRDCDVSVRGTRQGVPYFALVECKDWKKRVGIGVVDALDSKRGDLKADLVAIYSNSGFTAPAVQKASRVNINTFTAFATGDSRSRARGNTLAYGRGIKVANLIEQVIEPMGQDLPVPEGLGGLCKTLKKT